MTKTETVIPTKFHDFLKQRSHRTNVSMQMAQRLINLYRVLGSFGADFVTQYNTMLLNSSDDVQMALNALVSGQEVRQYLEFLRKEEKTQDDETSETPKAQVGWLPSPSAEQMGTSSVAQADLAAFMKAEEEKFAQMIAALRAEQEAAIKHLSDQLTTTLQMRPSNNISTSKEGETSYSEIIEEKGREKP